MLATAVPVVVLLAGWLQERRDEQVLRDTIAVDVGLEVVAASSAWAPGGSGRVEYFLVLHNRSPRPATLTGVRIERPGLTGSGSPVRRVPVASGDVSLVPLSLQLDCRRWRSGAPRRSLSAVVAVVAASGRSEQVVTAVSRAEALTGVADTVCRLYPRLRVAEMSGPVRPSAGAAAPAAGPCSRPGTGCRTP